MVAGGRGSDPGAYGTPGGGLKQVSSIFIDEGGCWPILGGWAAAGGPGGAMSTTANPALANIPQSRRQILEHIKRRGEAGTDEIAATVGITLSGARQHLTALERDGLLAHRPTRLGPGRPRHLYALTAAGDALFPRNYVELTNELLEYVADEDPALLTRIFDRRADRRLRRAR